MRNGTERDRLRLLILAPFSPRMDTPHGGGRVLAHFLAKIGSLHQVALLFMRAPDEPPIDSYFSEHCDLVEEVLRPWAGPSPFQKLWRVGRLLASLERGKPMWVNDWESRRYAERVRAVARAWRPDIVQFELHIMAQYATALGGCPAPRVLVEYEPGILAAPYVKGGPAVFRRLVHRLDQSAWAQYEPAILRQVQAVVTLTDKDYAALASFGLSVPITRIPIGTNVPEQSLDPLGRSPNSLLFLGNFLHPPNIEAALRLARDIFPPLRKDFPELTLYIVGPQPPTELAQYASASVVITGWVPDLAPYLDRAAVFVAPLCSGGGMRVKILEALSAGKAVVATPLAVEGLDLRDGEEVLLGKSDSEMIQRIRQLLVEPERRVALAGRARAWACANLGWEKPVAAYEQLYRALLERPVN